MRLNLAPVVPGPRRRKALSIPLVVIIASLMFIMLLSFSVTRTTVKRQLKKTLGQVKATYMAKAGIQHALLKLRVLPNESYFAGALSRGLCPSFIVDGSQQLTPGDVEAGPLAFFISDLTSADDNYVQAATGGPGQDTNWNMGNPFGFDAGHLAAASDTTIDTWRYDIQELRVLSSYRDQNQQVYAVEIVMEGTVVHNVAGREVEFKDIVSQVVEVRRGFSNP